MAARSGQQLPSGTFLDQSFYLKEVFALDRKRRRWSSWLQYVLMTGMFPGRLQDISPEDLLVLVLTQFDPDVVMKSLDLVFQKLCPLISREIFRNDPQRFKIIFQRILLILSNA